MTKSPLPQVQLPQQFVQDNDEIDLRQYLYVLDKYKWSILGLTFVIMILTNLYVYSIVPTYRAVTTLLIEKQKENIVSIEELYGIPRVNAQYLLTQIRIASSETLRTPAIEE